MKEYKDLINQIITDIENNDGAAINSFFASSREYRDSIPNNTSGVIRMFHELFVDIPDEPGAIAKITAILAEHNINLKNLGISHNREDEEGVLRISFYDKTALSEARTLLDKCGYKIYNR